MNTTDMTVDVFAVRSRSPIVPTTTLDAIFGSPAWLD
jgi:hypothetical protein